MINLVNKIKAELVTEVHPRVYVEERDKNFRYPYILMNLVTSNDDERKENFVLEVDVYENLSKQDTKRLEDLADKVNKAFKFKRLVGSDFHCRLKRINRINVPDPDPNVRRRQLRFLVTTTFK